MQVTTSFGGRLPKQIQRALPLCLAFSLFFLFYTKASSLGSTIQPATSAATDVFKRIYSYQKPLKLDGEEFPKKIWQIWKIDSLDFEERELTRARTWTTMNPTYRYEALTDGNSLRYVETHFGPNGLNRPDIVYIYRTLTAKIIQADLLRYLVMYVEGGTYADIDVEALQPIDNFIPPTFDEKDVDLVISVEIDEPNFWAHKILGPKSQSFCQWTFMSKPRAPVMMRLIENILEWLQDVAQRQNRQIADIELNFDEVLTGTGPSAFTTAVLADMKAQLGHDLQWETFHALAEPVLVGNILVLTVEAFAAGQGHSNSGNHNSPKALVKHHYHASLWPERHPRFSHPAYGMVEECNWEPECVAAWDSNTLTYETLQEDQKQQLIEKKKTVDAQRFDAEQAELRAAEQQVETDRQTGLMKQCLDLGWTAPTAPNATAAPTPVEENQGMLVGLHIGGPEEAQKPEQEQPAQVAENTPATETPSEEKKPEEKPEQTAAETSTSPATPAQTKIDKTQAGVVQTEAVVPQPAQTEVRRDTDAIEKRGEFRWGEQR